jgi:hypothetical protein
MTDEIGAMADAILRLINERHGSVSFAELSSNIPGFAGDMALFFANERCSNVCIWPSVSKAAADAIDALRAANAIHTRPAHFLVYLHDGCMPRMPLVKHPRHYRRPHWMPVVFYAGPSPQSRKRKRSGARHAQQR